MSNWTTIAVAVVQAGEQFLVGRRGGDQALAGYWEFPGGKVDPGESPAEAAVRECWEETGLRVEVVGAYEVRRHTYSHDAVELHFFACRPDTAGTVEPRAPYCWQPRAALSRLEFPPANRHVVRRLCGD